MTNDNPNQMAFIGQLITLAGTMSVPEQTRLLAFLQSGAELPKGPTISCHSQEEYENLSEIIGVCHAGNGELVPARIVQMWKEDSAAYRQVEETVMHRTQTVQAVAPPPFTGPVPNGVTPASFATTPPPADQPKKQSRRERRANRSGDGPGGLIGVFSGQPRT